MIIKFKLKRNMEGMNIIIKDNEFDFYSDVYLYLNSKDLLNKDLLLSDRKSKKYTLIDEFKINDDIYPWIDYYYNVHDSISICKTELRNLFKTIPDKLYLYKGIK